MPTTLSTLAPDLSCSLCLSRHQPGYCHQSSLTSGSLSWPGCSALSLRADTGESVADSPYPLRVLPSAPDPRKSAICTEGPATVGAAAEFRVEARDVFGNRCLLLRQCGQHSL